MQRTNQCQAYFIDDNFISYISIYTVYHFYFTAQATYFHLECTFTQIAIRILSFRFDVCDVELSEIYAKCRIKIRPAFVEFERLFL